MKKTFSVVVGLFMFLMLSGVSFSAAPGPYVSGQLGMAFLTDSDLTDGRDTITVEFDPGLALGLAAGYNFGMFRVEGEIGYQKNDIDKVSTHGISVNAEGDTTCLSFLVNGYLDFLNSSPLTPYISAGIGVAKVEVNDFAIPIADLYGGNADDTVFAYQVGVGLGYAINKNLTIDLKYRYFATEDPEIENGEAEFASHNVSLGLRYNF